PTNFPFACNPRWSHPQSPVCSFETRKEAIMPRSIVCPAALALLAGAARAQSFSESFSDIATLPGSGWVMQNNSQPLGTNSWFQGNPNEFPAQSAPGYIAANINSAAGAGTISNWLITPPRTISNGDTLQFYTRAFGTGSSMFPDR